MQECILYNRECGNVYFIIENAGMNTYKHAEVYFEHLDQVFHGEDHQRFGLGPYRRILDSHCMLETGTFLRITINIQLRHLQCYR